MKMKLNDLDAPGTTRMTDAELSKKLGHYQKMSVVWLWVAVAGAVSGTISFFVVQDTALKVILVTVLFFGGICCAFLFGGGAQKKLKALMQEQLGDFFRTELEKAFGPDIRTPQMHIDESFMKTLHLLDGEWEECSVENFHEGNHSGVHFSAANVRLDHVYQRGTPRDGYETCTNMVFKGLVLRCAACVSITSPVLATARTEDSPRGVLTGHEVFDRSFCVMADNEQDVARLLTPQFIDFLIEFDRNVEGQLLGLCWKENTFSLVLETDYGFAAVASSVDLRNIDAIRQSYINSLQEMGNVLDMLMTSSALTCAADMATAGGVPCK